MPFPDTELLEYVNLGLQDPVASSALLTWAMQYVTGMMFVISELVRTKFRPCGVAVDREELEGNLEQGPF